MRLLEHRADLRTLAVMGLVTLVAVLHWRAGGFSPALFAASLALAFAIAPMNHNHSHRPLWRHAALNHASDAWFTLFQGHPGYVFAPMHVDIHHRFLNGPGDVTRTDLHRDSNDLRGLLLHPLEFAYAAAPHILAHLRRLARSDRRALAVVVAHYLLLLGVDAIALWLDWRAALYVLLLPQAAALFWLLASNYLQHAHARGGSAFDHSRNFLGAVNWLGFNVGYHTAHHHEPGRHWSELPRLHAELAPRIAPSLNERSFAAYCLRTFVFAHVDRRHASRSLRDLPEPAHERHSPVA